LFGALFCLVRFLFDALSGTKKPAHAGFAVFIRLAASLIVA